MAAALTVIDHPLIGALLTRLRTEDAGQGAFRRHLHEISRLMAFEVTRDLATREVAIRTPLAEARGTELLRPLVLVPILRAGLGMLTGITDVVSDALVGHIGMARDPDTHRPFSYYCNLPARVREADVLLIDPMLATGHSAAEAAAKLKAEGAERLRFVNLVSCPEGIAHFTSAHPDIPVFTAAIDERLDDRAYIVPGLGDAGDRYFGTI